MGKTIKYFFLGLLAFLLIYICLSWFLLNGKIVYTTSFNENNIEASKAKNLFVSSNLKVFTEGDSLTNWQNIFDIWTNKRYEITYYGFLFHRTSTKSDWRYLNVRFKDGAKKDNWCVKRDTENFCSECCNRVGSNTYDTITISFFEFRKDIPIGKLKIIVE